MVKINPEDLNKGEIYEIKNKINGKKYIGQAQKYVSKNNNTWGTEGRFKSHIREAFSKEKDHCVILNAAIRKYGPKNFEVRKVCDCLISEMDDLEDKYIEEFKTYTPHGYNIIRKKKGHRPNRAKHTFLDHSEETKEKISKGQLGNRRKGKVRASGLPKYICYVKKKGEVVGYVVNQYPIGITEKKYITKAFTCGSLENCYMKALLFLDELEEKYAYIYDEIKKNKKEVQKKSAKEKFEEKCKKGLPSNIYPLIKDTKLLGYSVRGLKYHKDKSTIPAKKFTDKTNRWNLDNAKKYIETVNKINKNKIEVSDWDNLHIGVRNKISLKNEILPEYINYRKSSNPQNRGEIVGYAVNGYKIKLDDGTIKKFYKSFCDKRESMEVKFKKAVDCLNEIKKKYPSIE